MGRVVHKATDALSPAAWRAMVAGFREKLPAKMVAARVERETGEKVTERTVSRRMREWHLEQERRRAAREQMLALVEAAREGNYSAAEMINALATDALMMNPNGFAEQNPIKVQAQNLRAEELRIKREAVELRKREVGMEERKLDVLLDKQRNAAAALEAEEQRAKGGGQVTAEDLRRIREMYGLAAATAEGSEARA